MGMTIDWEYFFPDVNLNPHDNWSNEELIKIQDENGTWSPQKDFEWHMQKLKVHPKYFEEKNLGLFPSDFDRPLYSIKRYEEARVELLHRIRFMEGTGVGGSATGWGYVDEDGEGDIYEFRTYRIVLDDIDELVEVDPGTISSNNQYHCRRKRNVVPVHRFNGIYFLYDWLLSLSPGGACNNNHWQIFAYGISETDQTCTSVDTFVPKENIQPTLPGLGMVNETTIISQQIRVDSERIYPYVRDAHDVRSYLKNWNPFL